MDENCIFCKIIAGEIPSVKVYEDDQVLAFLDISQATPGHTLLVPKRHIPDIFAYDEALAQAVFARVPKLARAIKAADPRIKGMNILNNNGEVAYQSVFHSHIHLIPRFGEDDDFSIHFGDHTAAYTNQDLQAIAQQIRQEVQD